jgi:hypothetical protein
MGKEDSDLKIYYQSFYSELQKLKKKQVWLMKKD